MLSKNDYKNYLEQIKKIENQMVEEYSQCKDRIDDPKIKKILISLVKAEQKHENLVKRLVTLFD